MVKRKRKCDVSDIMSMASDGIRFNRQHTKCTQTANVGQNYTYSIHMHVLQATKAKISRAALRKAKKPHAARAAFAQAL